MGKRKTRTPSSQWDPPVIAILWTATDLSTWLACRRCRFRIKQYRELQLDLQIPEQFFLNRQRNHQSLGYCSTSLTLVPQESEFPFLASSRWRPWLPSTDQAHGGGSCPLPSPRVQKLHALEYLVPGKVTSVKLYAKFVSYTRCVA